MRRVQGSLPKLVDLVLVLTALLGGAGVGQALLLPPAVRRGQEQEVLVASDAAPLLGLASPASAAVPGPGATGPTPWRSGHAREADAGAHSFSMPRTSADAADRRQELQHVLTSPYLTEAPAGAHRYPMAMLGDPRQDDLLIPHASSEACRGQGDARCLLSDAFASTHSAERITRGQGQARTTVWINMPTSIGSTSPP